MWKKLIHSVVEQGADLALAPQHPHPNFAMSKIKTSSAGAVVFQTMKRYKEQEE